MNRWMEEILISWLDILQNFAMNEWSMNKEDMLILKISGEGQSRQRVDIKQHQIRVSSEQRFWEANKFRYLANLDKPDYCVLFAYLFTNKLQSKNAIFKTPRMAVDLALNKLTFFYTKTFLYDLTKNIEQSS